MRDPHSPAARLMMSSADRKLPPSRTPSTYRVAAAKGGKEARIDLYGIIGSSWWDEAISASQFNKDLKALGAVDTIHLHINSEGGDVFDAQAMYSNLTQHQARVVCHIDGLAASAASFLAMAGDEIRIAEGAWMMIHNAWSIAMGDAAKMREAANLLDSVSTSIGDIYAARTGKKCARAEITTMMDAETWMNGRECVDKGFADVLVENKRVAALLTSPANFRNLPRDLLPGRAAARAALERIDALR